jgi:hypothetical protein
MLGNQIGMVTDPVQRSTPIEMAVDMRFIVDQVSQALQVVIGDRPDRKLEDIREHETVSVEREDVSYRKTAQAS